MNHYGFIGLGIMGSAMAKNLLKAGCKVTVWNRSAAKCEDLAALGANVASSPKEVAASCAITFGILADPSAARQVALGENGVVAGIGGNRGYVDLSTVDEGTSRKIAAAVTAAGGRFLEAPVSGSKKPAEDGTLIILAAGERTLYDEALPALEKMGKKILFLGETGNGARMKLVVNMMMGEMMTALCEGLALGQKGGLSAADILEVVDAGAMANPMYRLKGNGITSGNFATAFPLKHMQKDLRLALALGDSLAQPLPAAACVNETFKRAREMGFGDEDFSAVYKAIS